MFRALQLLLVFAFGMLLSHLVGRWNHYLVLRSTEFTLRVEESSARSGLLRYSFPLGDLAVKLRRGEGGDAGASSPRVKITVRDASGGVKLQAEGNVRFPHMLQSVYLGTIDEGTPPFDLSYEVLGPIPLGVDFYIGVGGKK